MPHLHDEKIKQLEELALQIRQDIIEMLLAAGSGHTAGSLDMTDVFVALYFGGVLKYDPKNPTLPDRDRLVLSAGHICPVLYATLARAGYFPVEDLKTLRKFGSHLQGHPHRGTPGVETSSGPLGHSASMALGMAIAAKLDNKKHQIYCVVGDGEQDEGMIWEMASMASKLRLDNLTFIMDRNNIQIDGYTEDVMPLEPIRARYEAFGWHVLEVDGHNIRQIVEACDEAKAIFEKPVMIIAHTIPGKGIDAIEFDYLWHGKVPSPDEGKQFLDQLRTLGGKIISEHQ